MNKSTNIADMINATDSLELQLYLTDLATLTTTSSFISHDIPILDMLNKNVINSKTVKMLVMDEADELLSDGFIHQIKNIISSSYYFVGYTHLQIITALFL